MLVVKGLFHHHSIDMLKFGITINMLYNLRVSRFNRVIATILHFDYSVLVIVGFSFYTRFLFSLFKSFL